MKSPKSSDIPYMFQEAAGRQQGGVNHPLLEPWKEMDAYANHKVCGSSFGAALVFLNPDHHHLLHWHPKALMFHLVRIFRSTIFYRNLMLLQIWYY